MNYQNSWRELKKRRNIQIALLVTMIIIVSAADEFLSNISGKQNIGQMIFNVFIPFIIWAHIRFRSWKCPRCKEVYSKFSLLLGESKCSNCGLKKWADP